MTPPAHGCARNGVPSATTSRCPKMNTRRRKETHVKTEDQLAFQTKVELVVKVVHASTVRTESRLPPPLSWIDSRRVAGFICSAYARINFRQRLGALKDFTNFGLPSTDVAMSYRRADRATRFLRHEFLRPERRTIRGHCVKSLD